MNTPPTPDPIPADLQRWLDEQPDGAELAHVWQLAGHAAPPPAADTAVDAAWSRMSARLARGRLAEPPTGGRHPSDGHRRAADRAPRRPAGLIRVATALGLVGILAIVAAIGWGRQPVTLHAHEAAMAVVLPDGSAVTLAPGSSLTHRRAFRERAVSLVGQARFEVTPGESFTVETFNAEIAVLGTAFDVRAWPVPDAPEAAETDVVVFEGRVALRARGAERGGEHGSVELTVGQRARVVGSAARPDPVEAADLAAADAWRTATFAAYDTPLAGLVAQIERQFDTRVRLGAAVDPGRRVTALLPHADTAEAVLADLAAYLGYRLDRRPNGSFDLR